MGPYALVVGDHYARLDQGQQPGQRLHFKTADWRYRPKAVCEGIGNQTLNVERSEAWTGPEAHTIWFAFMRDIVEERVSTSDAGLRTLRQVGCQRDPIKLLAG